MKRIIALAVGAVVLFGLFVSAPQSADREACVSAIEATNNAAGVRTDYEGAYKACRNS